MTAIQNRTFHAIDSPGRLFLKNWIPVPIRPITHRRSSPIVMFRRVGLGYSWAAVRARHKKAPIKYIDRALDIPIF